MSIYDQLTGAAQDYQDFRKRGGFTPQLYGIIENIGDAASQFLSPRGRQAAMNLVEVGDMVNPVAGQYRAGQDFAQGDYVGAMTEVAGVLMPAAIVAKYGPQTALAAGKAIQETLTGTGDSLGQVGSDVYEAFIQRMNQPGEMPTVNVFAGPMANLSDMQSNKAVNAEIMLEDNVNPRKVFEETQRFIGGDNILRFEIPDQASKLKKTDTGTYNLNEVLDHPDLFEAYPFLENMPVTLTDDLNARGQFDRGNKSISLLSDRGEDEIKSTLLHEVQHAIQDHEGFLGRGSSIEKPFLGADPFSSSQAKSFARQLSESSQYAENYSKARKYREKSMELRPLYTASYLDSLDAIINRAREGGEKPRDLPRLGDWYKYSDIIRFHLGAMPQKKGADRSAWVANAASLMKKYHLEDLRPYERLQVEDTFNQLPSAKDRKNAVKRTERQRDKFRENAGVLEALLKRIESAKEVSYDPVEAYYRNAGEVEARNVQNRASGDKSDILPSATQ